MEGVGGLGVDLETGCMESKVSISWRRMRASALCFQMAEKSEGVLGARDSYPGRMIRSAGLVREVRKSAVVDWGGWANPREVKYYATDSGGPK